MSDVFETNEYNVNGNYHSAAPRPSPSGGGGAIYDVEMNQNLDEMTLTEDGSDKTTLPLIAEYVGTRANYENLNAEEQAKYRIVHFKGDGGFGDISDNQVAFTSEDCSDANATTWTSVTPLETGLSLRTLFNRVSQMFKNVRYLHSALTDVESDITDLKASTDVSSGFYFDTSAVKNAFVEAARSGNVITVYGVYTPKNNIPSNTPFLFSNTFAMAKPTLAVDGGGIMYVSPLNHNIDVRPSGQRTANAQYYFSFTFITTTPLS